MTRPAFTLPSQGSIQQLFVELTRCLMAYHSGQLPLDVHYKIDGSPVTAADLAAHQLIVKTLTNWLPIPIISEEDEIPPLSIRKLWSRYWLVDPLDGTRDFVQRTDEFSVNIALIEQQRTVWGLLILPAKNCYFTGGPGLGVYRQDASGTSDLQIPAIQSTRLGLSLSRYQPTEVQLRQQAFVDKLPRQLDLLPCSGAVKFVDLIAGRAHLYPRFSSICEWDLAAGDALLQGLGGLVVDQQLQPYRYNQHQSLQEACFLALSHADLLPLAGHIWQAQMQPR